MVSVTMWCCRGNNTEAINKSEQWRMKQPRKREFTINGAVLNMAVDETMIGLGTSEAFAVMLQADTGEEVWTMRCEEDEVCSRMEKTDELVQVQLSIAKDVVVTVTTSGQVTVWDIRNHEICYREAHHGHIPIYGVCAFGDLIVTGGSDGSLAILTVNKTQQRVQFESLTRNVGQINHLDCDMDYLLMSTAENMKLYSLADRANPKVINTAPTGPVNVCALAYPFAAVTCFEQKGIEVWDMVGCVKIRHLHASIGFRLLHIKDNILAANTRTGQTEDAKIYIHYVGELTNKKIKHEDLWTRRIDCSSEILTPCFGLSSTSLIGITLDGEAGAWSGTSTIAVWDFV